MLAIKRFFTASSRAHLPLDLNVVNVNIAPVSRFNLNFNLSLNHNFPYIKPFSPAQNSADLSIDAEFRGLTQRKLPLTNGPEGKFAFWPMEIRNPSLLQINLETARVVGFLGRFSSGKTTIMSMLSESIQKRNPLIGINATTQGLNFYHYELDRPYVVIDSEGVGTPCKSETQMDEVHSMMCKEHLIRNFLGKISDVLVYVTTQFTLQEEVFVTEASRGLRRNQRIIVIHNPFHLRTVGSLVTYAKLVSPSSILRMLEPREPVGGDLRQSNLWDTFRTLTYGHTENPNPLSPESNLSANNASVMERNSVRHYFFASSDIEGGESWNRAQIASIQSFLRNQDSSHNTGGETVRLVTAITESFYHAVTPLLVGHLPPLDHVLRPDTAGERGVQPGFWVSPNDVQKDSIKVNWISPVPVVLSESAFRGVIKRERRARYFILEVCCLRNQVTVAYDETRNSLAVIINLQDDEDLTNVSEREELELANFRPMITGTRSLQIPSTGTDNLPGSICWLNSGRLHIWIPAVSCPENKKQEMVKKASQHGKIDVVIEDS